MDAETERLAIELIRGLRVDVAELRSELGGMKGEMFGELGSLRTGLRAEFKLLRANIATDLSNYDKQISEQIDSLRRFVLECHAEVVGQAQLTEMRTDGPKDFRCLSTRRSADRRSMFGQEQAPLSTLVCFDKKRLRFSEIIKRFHGDLQVSGSKMPNIAHVTHETFLYRNGLWVELQIGCDHLGLRVNLNACEILDAFEGHIHL